MSYQEKNNFVTLLSSVLVFSYYFWRVSELNQAGSFSGADATSLIGQAILWLIVGGIVVNIVAHIGFAIIHAIITNDPKPSFVVDERDKLIELRALRWAYYIMGAGFITAMIALAMGQTPFLVFNLIILSFGVAGVVENLIQLLLYRRGV